LQRKPLLILLLAAAVSIGACSGADAESEISTTSAAPTTTSSTTTTLPTTTTTPPLTLEGGGADLALVVDNFYKYASAEVDAPPLMAEPILASMTPTPGPIPREGSASVGSFDEQAIATVTVGEDIFLLVADGGGWRIVGGEWPSQSIPAYYGPSPRLIAVIGSDARPGEDVERSRADSIHFVGLNGSGGGAVVGLPRDSYVAVPGQGKRKITGALALGGPDLLMQTITGLTSLPLEGYVMTGFSGFQDLVTSVLGGVEVNVPFAINDKAAKAALSAGQQLLSGFDALAFARARKTVPGGDFTRSEHQGVILLGAARGVQALGVSAIPGLMQSAEPYLFTDLTAEELLTFSALAIKSDIDSIPNVVAPGRAGSAGGASVVFLADSVNALFADLGDGTLEN
jgi:polyisoprenyl-teichoic acid--peptidoglycan teichoic acid transferase